MQGIERLLRQACPPDIDIPRLAQKHEAFLKFFGVRPQELAGMFLSDYQQLLRTLVMESKGLRPGGKLKLLMEVNCQPDLLERELFLKGVLASHAQVCLDPPAKIHHRVQRQEGALQVPASEAEAHLQQPAMEQEGHVQGRAATPARRLRSQRITTVSGF